ncbi:MAG: nucleotidyltransferase domain-containing protein [Deltaproteobacteria bacterium]|nr:nucleotidyltransferase domain-containing protein [Deltaproteobacteria bacterium]
MISPKLHWPVEQIEAFCRKWKIVRMEMFGSALRDDFRDDSDVDLLVEWLPDARWSLFDHVHMEDEISEILGRKVDLISRRGLERSANPYRKDAIMSTARPVYEAG